VPNKGGLAQSRGTGSESDGRRAMLQRPSAVISRQTRRRISRRDWLQSVQKTGAEVADVGESLPKLLTECVPNHELQLA
jgi:hypothetical protein